MEAEGAVPVRAAYSTYVPRTEDDSEDEAASEGQVEPELAEAEAASVAQAAKALTISTAEDETGGEGAEGEAVAVVPSTETKSAAAHLPKEHLPNRRGGAGRAGAGWAGAGWAPLWLRSWAGWLAGCSLATNLFSRFFTVSGHQE